MTVVLERPVTDRTRRPPAHAAPRAPRPLPPALVALVGAAAAGVGLRVVTLFRAPLALDELEHLHGAYLVHRGQVPYLDFFQHHPPLYYEVLGRLPLFGSPGWSTLLWARLGALVAALATAGLLFWWARTIGGAKVAGVAVVFLAADYFSARHGTRAYLDSFATPLAVAALALVGGRHRTLGRTALAGLCAGSAVLVTQKAAVIVPALVVGLLLDRPDRRRAARLLASLVAGVLAVGLIGFLALGPSGGRAFVRDAITLNLRWKARHRPTQELGRLLLTGAGVYLLATVSTVRTVAAIWRRRGRPTAAELPAVALLGCGIGALVLPVVYDEYFVLPTALACVVAAPEAVRLWASIGRRRLAAAGLALVTVAIPFAFQLVGLRLSNGDDRRRLELVQAMTGPDDPVFDTYTGYGAFRPHLYRYWLLHDELQAMVEPASMEREILAELQWRQPRVVLEDRFSATLPVAVRDYVTARYRLSELDGVWCRADLAARCGPPVDDHRFGRR